MFMKILWSKRCPFPSTSLAKKNAKKDGWIGLQSRYRVQTLNPCRQCAMEDHLQKPRKWRKAAMKLHETWVGDMFLFRLSKKILLVLTRTRAAPRIQEVKDIDSQSGRMSKIKWFIFSTDLLQLLSTYTMQCVAGLLRCSAHDTAWGAITMSPELGT